jgi:hypothetical protein
MRWWRAGKPADGPPPQHDLSPRQLAAARAAAAQARAAYTARRAARLDDYTWLRGQGVSRAEAARRVGVTIRTAQRYDAHLRQAQAEGGGEGRAA